jgi:hypothetical protein
MVALGLLILVAAGVVGAAGVLGNDGPAHTVSPAFEVLGVEIGGSAGRLFLFGIIVGVAGALGIGMMLAGSKRRVRHRVENRRERRDIKGEAETLQQERDRLAAELEAERKLVAERDAQLSARQDHGVTATREDATYSRPATPCPAVSPEPR